MGLGLWSSLELSMVLNFLRPSSLVLNQPQSGKRGGKHLQVLRCGLRLEDRSSLPPEAAGF